MTQIIEKRPADSIYEKTLHFSMDPKLREEFVNWYGDIRFGKVLEEMDRAAGHVSYIHADGREKNLTIVTAACDRIDLTAPLRGDCDIRIRGQVNYVGRSSMEVGLRLDSRVDGKYMLVARAYFIMVARSGDSAAEVNPLKPETDEEKRRYEAGRIRSEKRRIEASDNYLKRPPNEKESALIHQLFLENKVGNLEGICMSRTRRESTLIMHPQDRNIHNKIFGGHIMRLSFELGWTMANLFCRRRPLFLCVDHFHFYRPVEIGSIVCITGLVTYTGRTSFIVEITVEVIHPTTGQREVTNVSYLTFAAVDEDRIPTPVPRIVPHTYEEGLKYLDGARRYHRSKALRAERGKEEPES